MTTEPPTWQQPDWLADMPYDTPSPATTRVSVRLEALDLQHARQGSKYHINEHGKLTVTTVKTGDGNPCTTPGCGYRTHTGLICAQCVEEWETCLGDIPALVEDLNLAERKAVKFAPTGGTSAGDPEVASLPAGYWLGRLRKELTGQIVLMCLTGHLAFPKVTDTVAMSRWLLRQNRRLPAIRRSKPIPDQPNTGADLVTDLTRMYLDCLAAIDAPTRRKYVRECAHCGLKVWARQDAERTTCTCGLTYDVAAEHEQRITLAREVYVTLSGAAGLSGLNLRTLQTWANRTELAVIKQDGIRWVRYGDVLDLADAKEVRA